jgi:hypothetical protein
MGKEYNGVVLLGISGKARSGKDTLSNYLLKEFIRFGLVKVAFADELKRRLMEDFDLSWEQMYGSLKEIEDERYRKPGPPQGCAVEYDDGRGLPPWYWTPREIMQFIGTDCYRKIDDDFWVKQLFKTLSKRGVKSVVISDCRFVSEVEAVLNRGGYHIRIYRDSAGAAQGATHASETALDDYDKIDFKVYNNGTLDDLKISANYLANLIKEDLKNGKKRIHG